jgi:hypothetical protein
MNRPYFLMVDAVFLGSSLGISPKILVKGQILNAGHFLQPATTAIGQTVIANSFNQTSE